MLHEVGPDGRVCFDVEECTRVAGYRRPGVLILILGAPTLFYKLGSFSGEGA